MYKNPSDRMTKEQIQEVGDEIVEKISEAVVDKLIERTVNFLDELETMITETRKS